MCALPVLRASLNSATLTTETSYHWVPHMQNVAYTLPLDWGPGRSTRDAISRWNPCDQVAFADVGEMPCKVRTLEPSTEFSISFTKVIWPQGGDMLRTDVQDILAHRCGFVSWRRLRLCLHSAPGYEGVLWIWGAASSWEATPCLPGPQKERDAQPGFCLWQSACRREGANTPPLAKE